MYDLLPPSLRIPAGKTRHINFHLLSHQCPIPELMIVSGQAGGLLPLQNGQLQQEKPRGLSTCRRAATTPSDDPHHTMCSLHQMACQCYARLPCLGGLTDRSSGGSRADRWSDQVHCLLASANGALAHLYQGAESGTRSTRHARGGGGPHRVRCTC